jgi:hypothetical protein
MYRMGCFQNSGATCDMMYRFLEGVSQDRTRGAFAGDPTCAMHYLSEECGAIRVRNWRLLCGDGGEVERPELRGR